MARTDFSVEIVEASVDINKLTKYEKIYYKKYDSAVRLDAIVTPEDPLVIEFERYIGLKVHNEKSDSKDYMVYLVLDKGGKMYMSSSDALYNELVDIVTDMDGEPFKLKIYKRESKNFKGKYFITCSIVF